MLLEKAEEDVGVIWREVTAVDSCDIVTTYFLFETGLLKRLMLLLVLESLYLD